MDITTNNPPARCLDLTRLVSRVGRGPWTGIDRVELAYLQWFLETEIPLFAVIKLGRSWVVLDRTGLQAIRQKLIGADPWGSPGIWANFLGPTTHVGRAVHLDIRRRSIGVSRKGKLARMLTTLLPSGTSYFNVGHSNLNPEMLSSIRHVNDAKVVVMIHDTIPLDFPIFQRPGTPEKFEEKIRLVGKCADLVIYNSKSSQTSANRYFSNWGFNPPSIFAHLGVALASPDPKHLPKDLDLNRPYFVTVGTIEPRKNHTLLLDIWEKFEDREPPYNLIIVGQRGWNNITVFKRLDHAPRGVTELNNLTDARMSALLKGSAGLLFPSLAEGFGFPPAEAVALDIPVVCGNLEVYKEILGEYPEYVDTNDMSGWETIIEKLANSKKNEDNGWSVDRTSIKIPTWDSHFNIVLKVA